jgi:hypothetical protein
MQILRQKTIQVLHHPFLFLLLPLPLCPTLSVSLFHRIILLIYTEMYPEMLISSFSIDYALSMGLSGKSLLGARTSLHKDIPDIAQVDCFLSKIFDH